MKTGDRVRWVGDGPHGPIGTLRCVQAPDMGGNHIWIVDVDGDRARSRKEFELEIVMRDGFPQFEYDGEAAAAYVYLTDDLDVDHTIELPYGVNVDCDEFGRVLGYELLLNQ